MKVGVISDSHGNVEAVNHCLEWFAKHKCDKVIHLGDEWDDIQIASQDSYGKGAWPEIIKIPGVFSDYYKDKKIPNRLIFEFDGWKVLLTHTREAHENDLPTDLKPEEVIKSGEANVILYGHTHIPLIERKHNIIYINPGHLRAFDKKGYQPSFALIEFTAGLLTAKLMDFKTKLPINSKIFFGPR